MEANEYSQPSSLWTVMQEIYAYFQASTQRLI